MNIIFLTGVLMMATSAAVFQRRKSPDFWGMTLHCTAALGFFFGLELIIGSLNATYNFLP